MVRRLMIFALYASDESKFWAQSPYTCTFLVENTTPNTYYQKTSKQLCFSRWEISASPWRLGLPRPLRPPLHRLPLRVLPRALSPRRGGGPPPTSSAMPQPLPRRAGNEMKPSHKPGHSRPSSNYRPISLITYFEI